jgi:osmotically-inducible protein OsmY
MTNNKETLVIADNALKSKVLAGLEWEPRINAAHIGVAATSGVVMLTGHVETYIEKYLAEAVVLRLKGVQAIAQEIEVRLPQHTQVADDDIASAAVRRLAQDVSVQPDTVRIKVEKGVVTLTGQVEWEYQRAAAAWDIRGMGGIVEISNDITVLQSA